MDAPLLTARLLQRPFTPGDAEAAYAMFTREEVGRFTGGVHRSIDDTRGLIAAATRHQQQHGFAMWAVCERETGMLVGEVGLQLLEQRGPEVEIGWSIHPDRWARGYASEAAAAWLEVAFGRLGLDAVVATILPQNAASRALAAKLGMTQDGARFVHGADHLVYVARAA